MTEGQESPRKHATVQEMIQHRSDQMKAEELAKRLNLLRRQEMDQRLETEQAQRMVEELSQRKEQHVKRVREKEEGLRKLRSLYHVGGLIQKPKDENPHTQIGENVQRSDGEGTLDATEGVRSSIITPFVGSAVLSGTGASQRSPNAGSLIMTSPRSPQLKQNIGLAPRSPQLKQNTGSLIVASPRTPHRNSGATKSSESHFSRFPTGDMMNLGYAQGAMVNRGAAGADHKARLGCYSFDGGRLWMTPRGKVSATAADQSPKHAPAMKGLGALSRKPPDIEPKELVRQLTRKEKELQDRLEAAKYAHELAEKDLENSFKSLTAVQISSRRAIREGNY